jgi:uncharacterized protein with HEPN domain
MPPSTPEYLRHILDEAHYLIERSAGLSLDGFLQDETLQRAFVRSLEIIGEAVKQVPEATRAQHPDVEWRSMAGMRDRLIHAYFSIDYEIVWDVVINKVPELAQQIQRLLGDQPGEKETL